MGSVTGMDGLTASDGDNTAKQQQYDKGPEEEQRSFQAGGREGVPGGRLSRGLTRGSHGRGHKDNACDWSPKLPTTLLSVCTAWGPLKTQ